MKSKYVYGLNMILISALMTLSACSGDTNEKGSPSPSEPAKEANSQSSTPTNGKYTPAIEVSTVRYTDAGFKFKDGESLDKNIWNGIFEDELGIKVKNMWVVDKSQYNQKLNVTIASGTLPDFFEVDKVTMQRLVDEGALEDLTAVYEKYGSPFAKKTLTVDGGAAIKASTVNGKLMAIPHTASNGGVASTEMIWLRTDWLKKVNLSPPKTMDDVMKIAEAFSKMDPDENGKNDTYGLAINKEMLQNFGSVRGFFNGYHAYPDYWVKDASGKIVFGSVQPEMKVALQKLQDLYKNGVLDKEFSVKDTNKILEDVNAEKIGLIYGHLWDPPGKTYDINYLKVKDAAYPLWQTYPIVSVDSAPVKVQANPTAETFFVVRKGVKNPEVVVKLLNTYLKKYIETDYSGSVNPFIAKDGIFPAKFAPVQLESPNLNLEAWYKVVDALKTGDGSKLDFPASVHFDRISKFRNGDYKMWYSDRTFGPEGAFKVIDQYDKQKTFVFDEFISSPTPTMVDKLSTLTKMEMEVFTKIIMNAAPVSDFDKFVEQWKLSGGSKIEQEANEAYKKNQGN
ncbi:extracellular solute-binding protein [Paenibacillus oryzisoli]|uniref:ABC transporter substrate-binding protein n=1 Tax=Paenibacillus oryzisoli TaxID=1850517 RepID=A0A198A9Q0_9BACL|nr:extracellular solute-binding protein [Paenibacillus oryzisoli]OAS17892.1 hypothetical protein A8708_28150 [Paenibacillus oryzisoli]